MVDHENAIRIRRHELAGALAMHDAKQSAMHVENLTRAVAREEIERAGNRQQDPPPSDTRTTPGGVRVVWTEEVFVAAHSAQEGGKSHLATADAALPYMRVTVDQETLRRRLERWTKRRVGVRETTAFARGLGIHLDGDNND